MKFLPESKKKRYWTIGLLVVVVLAVIYINFILRPSSQPAVAPPAPTPATGQSTGGQAAPSNVSEQLPFGDRIDISILQDARYQSLQSPPALTVSPEELGKANPFSSSTARPEGLLLPADSGTTPTEQ